ncbi:restriction endonuclease S subunit [Brassicibacter mesophilus]
MNIMLVLHINEQKRIVEKVDYLMFLYDELEEQTQIDVK